MRPDPPTMPDGSCAQCHKNKREVRHGSRTGAQRTAAGTSHNQRQIEREAEQDPFCSTYCCRKFHGLLTEGEIERKERTKRRCKKCGISTMSYTPGCKTCNSRRAMRKYYAKKRAKSASS
jgi:hypothetical protein